ncbi:hypothetical protein SAMN05444396_1222 [Flavobacterium segetis]|uniref:Uncharacterized protein n=1 Tax=Flavobacterium segetis TaxID=271157 RepID=A0A1M5K4P5_9FLAO|nr:hypothetical protein SAMN05444396_1222 [Flavobacterium segetis]
MEGFLEELKLGDMRKKKIELNNFISKKDIPLWYQIKTYENSIT